MAGLGKKATESGLSFRTTRVGMCLGYNGVLRGDRIEVEVGGGGDFLYKIPRCFYGQIVEFAY